MKILREGRMIKPVTFECGACECKFIAGQGEYKYIDMTLNEQQIFECQCPYCKNLVWKEIRLG